MYNHSVFLRKANSETPKRKKRRTSFVIEPILVPANHTADPANQSADAEDADNQLDENDPEFLLQNIINSGINIFSSASFHRKFRI